ncbi:MAG TPA: phosphatidylglycerophosphatase A [Phycisphaerales bacterium]|nr:phosphatidylglycerophosphatase A [Phycisphaerales bacterium]
MNPPRLPLLTTFGLGHMRIASGTWGSLPPCVVAGCLWLANLSPANGTNGSIVFSAVMGVILVIFSVACVLQGKQAEERWGKDPGEVVADETAGQCIPLMFLPAWCFTDFWRAVATVGAAFLLFRILDIIKPWPAKQIQSRPYGWGILLDDLFAGAYAAVIMQVGARLMEAQAQA